MSNFETSGQPDPGSLPDNALGNLLQSNQILSPQQVQQALFGLFQQVQQHHGLLALKSLLGKKNSRPWKKKT
jgi:hypothetical protein